ncbi:protein MICRORCHIDIA 6-like [Euphorbia lathyris]|uniref:protein MICRORCHIDIA 6-like n=1 Tax=Euphorbia lathyris TaxID=212925 RepID=UPI003314291C
MKESVGSRKDVALEEMNIPRVIEANEQGRTKTLEKHERLCKLSRAIAVLASASSISRELEESLKLVKEFDDVGSHGTKVIIYNLWLSNDEMQSWISTQILRIFVSVGI